MKKLNMKISHYASPFVTLRGPGVVEVEDKIADYLVKTFPNWFEEVKEEVKTKDVAAIESKEIKEEKLTKRGRRKRR